MPRWARFLSCTVTGLLFATTGFLIVAFWSEGGAGFWPAMVDFLATPAFWFLAGLFGLLVGSGLLLARVAVHLYRVGAVVAGVATGGIVALAYAVFLVASHAGHWGGMIPSLQQTWAEAALFALPFAGAGGFTAWLWDRLG